MHCYAVARIFWVAAGVFLRGLDIFKKYFILLLDFTLLCYTVLTEFLLLMFLGANLPDFRFTSTRAIEDRLNTYGALENI